MTDSTPSGIFKIELPSPFSGDGTDDFGQWSRRLEVAITASSDDEQKLPSLLSARLTGADYCYWDSLPSSVKKDYKTVKEKMKRVLEDVILFQRFKAL